MRSILILFLLLTGSARAQVSVGLPVRLTDVVIEGSEIEALPLDPKAPLEVRIVAVYPHGSSFRYDIEYVALEEGDFDAARSLRRKDGSTAKIAAIPIHVQSLLPPGIVKPHAPKAGAVPRLGGYRTWMIVLASVWIVGLIALLWAGRKRRHAALQSSATRAPTPAERLRGLVERAHSGSLSQAERAQLEMSLVAHWRRRLALQDQPASTVLPLLRAHAEAGPLLAALEEWLHAPPPRPAVDLNLLLAPYRDLQPDAMDLRAAVQR